MKKKTKGAIYIDLFLYLKENIFIETFLKNLFLWSGVVFLAVNMNVWSLYFSSQKKKHPVIDAFYVF